MAEEDALSGTGGSVFGDNNVQRSLDATERTVTRLDASVSKLVAAVDKLVGAAPAYGGSSGTSSSGQAPGVPNGGVTSHRAAGPPTVIGGGSGGAHRAGLAAGYPTGGMVAGTLAAAGAAYTAGSIARTVANPDTPAMARASSMTSSYYTGRPFSERTMLDLYGRNTTAHSSADMMGVVAGLAGTSIYTPGTRGFSQQLQGITGTSFVNPTMSNMQSLKGAQGLSSASTFNAMRSMGIQTLGPQGQARDPRQIAQQILASIPGSQDIKTMEQVTAELSQNSNLSFTLQSWVQSGAMPAEAYPVVMSEIRGILMARVKGNMSFKRYDQLMRQRAQGGERGEAAARILKQRAGVGGSLSQEEREEAAAGRQGAIKQLDNFEQGLRLSTEAMTNFRKTLEGAMPDWLTDILGFGKGFNEKSKIGSLLGITGGGLGILKTVGGMLGIGGTHDQRMTMGATTGSYGMAGSSMGAMGMDSGASLPVSDGSGSAQSLSTAMSDLSGGRAGSPSAGTSGIDGGLMDTGMPSSTDSDFGGPRGVTQQQQSSGHAGQGNKGRGKGKGKARGRLAWPCRGPITAKFGQAGGRWSSGSHTGLDIGVGSGTPVKAAASGTVTTAGSHSAYGNQIIINHGNGIQTRYAHNSRLKARKGAHVRQGEVIAHSGATGNVTGPHVHFEVIINGRAVDPLPYLRGKAIDINDAGGGSSNAPSTSGGGGSSSSSDTGAGSAGGIGYSTSEAEIVAAALAGGTSSGTETTTKEESGGGGGGCETVVGNRKYNLGGVKPWVAEAAAYLGNKYGIKTIGGVGQRSNASDHPSGHALDFMVRGSKGDQLAQEAIAKQKLLDVKYVIWKQRIWNTNSGDKHWRRMEDRGSPTANHMDHVHVSFDSSGKVNGLVKGGGGGGKSDADCGPGGGDLKAEKYRPGAGVGQWRDEVLGVMGQLGNKNPDKGLVDLIMRQMKNESGGNPNIVNKWDSNWQAGHPSVGLMQVIRGTFNAYAGPYRGRGPKKYGVSVDPIANIYAGLNYARKRYGSWKAAFRAGDGYERGAWEINEDEDTRVHKGEMIVDAIKARQIREVMMHNQPYGANLITGNRGNEAKIEFHEGAIKVELANGSSSEAKVAGEQIVDAIVEDKRIKQLVNF